MATKEPPPTTADYEDAFVHDDLIESAEAATSGSTNLFDLRTVIGALFTLYGVLLTILGIFDSQAEIDKAAGVHINLWTGLGMLVIGVSFLVWMWLRPLHTEEIAEAVEAAHEEEEQAA